MLKVGYQGKHGTFSEIAVMNYFAGQKIEQRNYSGFPAIMDDCDAGILDYAVLPVENTTTGIISRTYDLFKDHHVHAVGEIIVPIQENLLVNPGTKVEDIREVYSHPEALSQCQKFFASHPWMRAIAYQDTAAAVRFVKEDQSRTKAALGSALAGQYYGMETLAERVNDNDKNMTRFLVVTAKEEKVKDADKISSMLVLEHEPGSLYHALGILAYADINMLKLESRPIPQEPFHYMFYVDFSGNLEDPIVAAAITKLREHSIEFRILGNYRAADVK